MSATAMDPRPTRRCLWLPAAALSIFLGCAQGTPPSTPQDGPSVNWCTSGPPARQRTQPQAIKREPALSTPEAIAAGGKPHLPVECILLAEGRLINCKLLEPSPSMELSVYKALLNWRFTPALVDGVPAPAEITFNVPLARPEPGATPPMSPGEAPAPDAGQTPGNPLPFGVGMQIPQWIKPPMILMPREAREACIQGVSLVKCTVTTEGTFVDCRTIQSLPYMDQAILDAFKSVRVAPVLFQGKPVNVEYVVPFTVRLDLSGAR